MIRTQQNIASYFWRLRIAQGKTLRICLEIDTREILIIFLALAALGFVPLALWLPGLFEASRLW